MKFNINCCKKSILGLIVAMCWASQSLAEPARVLGVCVAVDNAMYAYDPNNPPYGFDPSELSLDKRTYRKNGEVESFPQYEAQFYFEKYEAKFGYFQDEFTIITELKSPKHGEWDEHGHYVSSIGYVGEDSATFLVKDKKNSIQIKVVYYFKVDSSGSASLQNDLCGDKRAWKISLFPNDTTIATNLESNLGLDSGGYSFGLATQVQTTRLKLNADVKHFILA